ncbi:hypothetical protein [Ruminiclostridium papyrosolvens]|uniref:Uncharacterized protein n=1 Tax=Ruminiclostridium papyrosolvens C7 TaxID=1330534 RepID=U4QWS1_9FIRM|nr:hypothetical protein [Ruminiclostridium papyrosolvens]EPR07766.1 hypothetical protein L323_19895 [Ruminiclostridium papyrosolvens C7]
MAEKEKQQESATITAPLFLVDELQRKKKIPTPILNGVCAAQGWKSGKMVEEEEFDAAVKNFSGTPIGKKVK